MALQFCLNNAIYELALFIFLKEEPCQSPDCQKFYKEHNSFIRELPTFKQQQDLNWPTIQFFRTLFSIVTEELHNQLFEKDIKNKSVENNKYISHIEITDTMEEIENVKVYLYSIEALMGKDF